MPAKAAKLRTKLCSLSCHGWAFNYSLPRPLQSTNIRKPMVIFHQAWPAATGRPSQNTQYLIYSTASTNLRNNIIGVSWPRTRLFEQAQRLCTEHIKRSRHDTVPNSPTSLQPEITWQLIPFHHQSQPDHLTSSVTYIISKNSTVRV